MLNTGALVRHCSLVTLLAHSFLAMHYRNTTKTGSANQQENKRNLTFFVNLWAVLRLLGRIS